MFIEIARLNKKGEIKQNLINTDLVLEVIELTQDPITLYDANGDVVETKEPTAKRFKVFLEKGADIVVDETNYQLLVKALVK